MKKLKFTLVRNVSFEERLTEAKLKREKKQAYAEKWKKRVADGKNRKKKRKRK